MPLYLLKVTASLDSRGKSGDFINTHLFRSNATVGASSYFDLAENTVDAYTGLFTNAITIRRVNISIEVPGRQSEQQKGRYMRFDYEAPGTRVLPANTDAAALSNVAEFKKQAGFGSVGAQLVRGAFMETEVQANKTGSTDVAPALNRAPFDAFATALYNAFDNAGMPLVMKAPPGADFVNGARPVTEIIFVGVAERQLNNPRTTIQTRLKQAAKAEAAELERQASIEAARAGSDDPSQWNPLVLQALMSLAGILLSRYGAAIFVATGLNRYVRMLLARIP